MTGSLDLLSASLSLKARGISIARQREAFHSAISGGKHQCVAGNSSMFFSFVFVLCVVVVLVFVFVVVFALVIQSGL